MSAEASAPVVGATPRRRSLEEAADEVMREVLSWPEWKRSNRLNQVIEENGGIRKMRREYGVKEGCRCRG